MSDEFHGDETFLTSHETPSFSLLAMSAKLMVFNAIKLSMKSPLRLTLVRNQHVHVVETTDDGELAVAMLVSSLPASEGSSLNTHIHA